MKKDDQYRRDASKFIKNMLAGNAPGVNGTFPDLGAYTDDAKLLVEAYRAGGTPAVVLAYETLSKDNNDLLVLGSNTLDTPRGGAKKPLPHLGKFRPLPQEVQFPADFTAGVCPWLEDYEAFSKKWSPRSYHRYHRAAGLFALSTVAAGRVVSHFGGKKKTPLFIALTSKTSVYAKTSAARVAKTVLRQSSLDWLLFDDDDASPQKFIQNMAGKLPEHYGLLSPEKQRQAARSYAFSAQRGWYYEEFGQLVAAMNKANGHMTEFRGILRRMDDCEEVYRYGTIQRGSDQIDQPSLALMANMTPDDLRSSAKRGATMWGDGFWARWAFYTPPPGEPIKKDRWPGGEMLVPIEITQPLADWHFRLGEPEISIDAIVDGKGQPTGEYKVERITPLPENFISYGKEVYEAFYRYSDALLDMIAENASEDLNGNYVRFAEKAWRMMLLFASLEGTTEARIEHWALAQEIAEEMREMLHNLVELVNEPEPTYDEMIEEKVTNIVEKFRSEGRYPTMRNFRQFVYGVSVDAMIRMVNGLVKAGVLERFPSGRTEYYRFPEEGSEPDTESDTVGKMPAINLKEMAANNVPKKKGENQ